MLTDTDHYTRYARSTAHRASDHRADDPLNAARGMTIAVTICAVFWGAVAVAIFA